MNQQRTDYAVQDNVHPSVQLAQAANAYENDQAAPVINAVPVVVENVVLTRGLSAQHSTHWTNVMPPKSVALIAPEDNNRIQLTVIFPTITGTGTNPVPSQPSVPATTVAVQNSNAYPVNVVISAGTLTAVVVNGVTVGNGDGTYLVPSAGAISVTYSVAPTWAWSDANPVSASGYFVLCDALESAQATGNIALTAGGVPPQPAGTLLAMGEVFHENDNDVLYAVNTDPTSTLYLSVIMERGEIR